MVDFLHHTNIINKNFVKTSKNWVSLYLGHVTLK